MTNRLIPVLLLGSAALVAQGPRGPQGTASQAHPASALDMSKLQSVTGNVSAVNIAYGAQYPSITVNQAVIKIAPVWFLLENNFEVKAGDSVTVTAAPSTLPGDTYLYGVEITNNTTKAHIAMRNSAGIPLWSGPAAGRGNPDAPRTGASCVDQASIASITGKIDKVTLGAGIQMPTLVLNADGKLMTFKIGPERILLEADFELNPGQTVTVKYAYETCTEEYLALQITNTAGVTVTLRNDDGTPAWN